jgi:hypothetical protein
MDNRRKTIVINKKFQYQYSLLIVAVAVLLVNGFIILRMLFPGDQPLDLSTPATIGVAIVELILVASIWYGCLKASHRIAGPVYVFAREIVRLGEGDLGAKIVLRDQDMFQAEADKMNISMALLRAKVENVQGLCTQLQQAYTDGGNLGPHVEQLAKALSGFNTGRER